MILRQAKQSKHEVRIGENACQEEVRQLQCWEEQLEPECSRVEREVKCAGGNHLVVIVLSNATSVLPGLRRTSQSNAVTFGIVQNKGSDTNFGVKLSC